MLVVLQFPISDVRGLTGTDTARVGFPRWPTPRADREFVHSFGAVRQRWRGGLQSWIGEEYLCIADRVLRIPDSPESARLAKEYKFWVAFRTFYFDGYVVGKYEIGVAAKRKTPQNIMVADAIDTLLALPVMVADTLHGKPVHCRLANAGRPLARQYLTATTQRTRRMLLDDNDWWVCDGAPLLLVEQTTDDKQALGLEVRYNYPAVGSWPEMKQLLVPSEGRRIPAWFYVAPGRKVKLDKSDPAAPLTDEQIAVRELRICLLRVHAERECLFNVLDVVDEGRIPVIEEPKDDDPLQLYLKNATEHILEQQTIAAIPVVALANQYDDRAAGGVRPSLLEKVNRMRPYLRKMVGKVVHAKTELTGQQYEAIQAALIDAFNADGLRMMVRTKLGQRLDAIAGGGDVTILVFNLMDWAERTGRMDDLINGAVAANPRNPKLQEVVHLLA